MQISEMMQRERFSSGFDKLNMGLSMIPRSAEVFRNDTDSYVHINMHLVFFA